MSSPFFICSSACAAVVVACGLVAWLRGVSWEDRLPDGIRWYLGWTLVFFAFGLLDVLQNG